MVPATNLRMFDGPFRHKYESFKQKGSFKSVHQERLNISNRFINNTSLFICHIYYIPKRLRLSIKTSPTTAPNHRIGRNRWNLISHIIRILTLIHCRHQVAPARDIKMPGHFLYHAPARDKHNLNFASIIIVVLY